jgi:hypothetical protein
MQRNEEPEFAELCRKPDLIVCCSNTLRSRFYATRQAICNVTPLIDVALADTRVALTGLIKLWLPRNAKWSACPACCFAKTTKVPRGENIITTVATATATLAANMAVQLLLGLPTVSFRHNFSVVDCSRYRIEAIAVTKRKSCRVCNSK